MKELSDEQKYIDEGRKFHQIKDFRNCYAYRMRLLWSTNKQDTGKRYYIKKDLYEDIISSQKKLKKQLFEIIQDHKKYEKDIFSSDLSELVSSEKILKDTHDIIAPFINKSFEFIKNRI